jgi:hypothetical protein
VTAYCRYDLLPVRCLPGCPNLEPGSITRGTLLTTATCISSEAESISDPVEVQHCSTAMNLNINTQLSLSQASNILPPPFMIDFFLEYSVFQYLRKLMEASPALASRRHFVVHLRLRRVQDIHLMRRRRAYLGSWSEGLRREPSVTNSAGRRGILGSQRRRECLRVPGIARHGRVGR